MTKKDKAIVVITSGNREKIAAARWCDNQSTVRHKVRGVRARGDLSMNTPCLEELPVPNDKRNTWPFSGAMFPLGQSGMGSAVSQREAGPR